MIFFSAAALLLFTTSVTGDNSQATVQYRRVVRERIVIRVPARTGQITPATIPQIWLEGPGPKCIRAKNIAAAKIRGRINVDLILKNNRRFRAKLSNSCPALDYYYGFYILPNPDGLICVDRDVIRSRMGGQCGIEGFRSLRPVQRVAQGQSQIQ